MKIDRFIARHQIGFDAEMVESNPLMDDMPAGSTHWSCKLRCGRRCMTIPFSQGPAFDREPTAADVLDCLASDASGYDNCNGSFEDWCSDYGYDSDSRRAEKIFRAVKRQAEKLRDLLGADDYETLLYHVERG